MPNPTAGWRARLHADVNRKSLRPNDVVRIQEMRAPKYPHFCNYFETGGSVEEGLVATKARTMLSQRLERKPGRPTAIPRRLIEAEGFLYVEGNGYHAIPSMPESDHDVSADSGSLRRMLFRLGIRK
jgi:hypothetical protein